MFGEIFDASSSQSALWAVILGALLATAGGFVATQIERIVEQRRRERYAALFFGELLTTLAVVLRLTEGAHGRGDPFGAITLRMLQSARKEIEIYDRNRETLFDLRHADLRARIQTLMVSLTMPIEGVFENSADIKKHQSQIRGMPPGEMRTDLENGIAVLAEQREGVFGFVIESSRDLSGIIRDLRPLANHAFRDVDEVIASI